MCSSLNLLAQSQTTFLKKAEKKVFDQSTKRTNCVEKTAISGKEIEFPHIASAIPTTSERSSVGITVGQTSYDLQTNNAVCRRLALDNNGMAHSVWTMSLTGDAAAPDRGTGYNTIDVNTLEAGEWPTDRLETDRNGWPNLGITESGRIFSISHFAGSTDFFGGLSWVYKNLEDTEWTHEAFPVGDGNDTWARAAVDGNTIHVIAGRQGADGEEACGLPGGLNYYRSIDGGDTWEEMPCIPGVNSDVFPRLSGDGYAIDASNGTVAIVAGTHKPVMFKGMDMGEMGVEWVPYRVLVELENPLYFPDEGTTLPMTVRTDESYSILIDNNNTVHVWYGRVVIENEVGDTGSWFPGNNGLMYWNDGFAEGQEPEVIGETVRFNSEGNDTSFVFDFNTHNPNLYFPNQVSMASSGIDADGNLYVSYSSIVEGAIDDVTGEYFRDLFLIKSTDGGASWIGPYNVSNNPSEEAVYGSMARTVTDKVHILYQSDIYPGIVVQQTQPDIVFNDINYVQVGIDEIVTPDPNQDTAPQVLVLSALFGFEQCHYNISDIEMLAIDYPDGQDLSIELSGTMFTGFEEGVGYTLADAGDGYTLILTVTDSDGNIDETVFEDMTILADESAPFIVGEPFNLIETPDGTFIEELFEFFDTISVVQGTPYVDLGADIFDDADVYGCEATLEIDIPSALLDGTAEIGSYTVTYSGIDNVGNPAEDVVRVVNVVGSDLNAPVIYLIDDAGNITAGNLSETIEAGSGAWEDDGFIGVDDIDGLVDVTVSGTVDTETLGTYEVTYTATDAAGNETTVVRTVEVVDTTPPVIGLTPATLPLNAATPAFNCGDQYYFEFNAEGQLVLLKPDGIDANTDPDIAVTVTAFDGYDGNITDQIEYTVTDQNGNIYGNQLCTEGSVTYTVTFSVTDNSGNTIVRDDVTNPLLQPLTIIVVGCDGNCPIVGIEENNLATAIDVYPNPTSGIVNINLASDITEADMTVYNAAGKIVATANAQTPQFDLSEAAAGIYFVKITTNKGDFVQKIVLEN